MRRVKSKTTGIRFISLDPSEEDKKKLIQENAYIRGRITLMDGKVINGYKKVFLGSPTYYDAKKKEIPVVYAFQSLEFMDWRKHNH